MSTIRSTLAVVLAASLLAGCGETSLEELTSEAQTAFDQGDYEETCLICESAIARSKSEGAGAATSWRFEQLDLLAHASLGKDGVTETLSRLSEEYASQADDANLYVRLTKYLSEADNIGEAIEVLEAGKERFPEMAPAFDAEGERLAALAEKSGDSAAIEKLKSLGYL